jgi:hypothetical protein
MNRADKAQRGVAAMSSEWPMWIMQASVIFLLAGALFIKA